VPHLRRDESLHARVLSRLGWVFEVIPGQTVQARKYYRLAHEHESEDPYYLCNMLGYEVSMTHQPGLLEAMRATILKAIEVCCSHAAAGIEMPRACFTAGRLSLLLSDGYVAFGYYARGVRHCLAGTHAAVCDPFGDETAWITRLHEGEEPSPGMQWVLDLLSLAESVADVAPDTMSPERTLIISGGAASIDAEALAQIKPLLEVALDGFAGLVISGGTRSGVPGCVGAVAAELAEQNAKEFDLIAYIPERLPHDAPKDTGRYDHFIACGQDDFSPQQLVCMWRNLLADGRRPQDVLLLGFGGGPVSAAEYQMALALGASVAVVCGTGGAVDALVNDPLWQKRRNLLPLPFDIATVKAFAANREQPFPEDVLAELAQAFHANYVESSSGKLPKSMRPWDKLAKTFKTANYEQACHAVQILQACDYAVRESADPVKYDFSDAEVNDQVQRMAELEHGRWNVERLRDGWRKGDRDDTAKLHDSLVSWNELPARIRQYDLDAVLNFPNILAKANLEVFKA
jgi:RyR domain